VECVALLVGYGEFHDGSSTHTHVFREYPTVLIDLGVGWSQCGSCVVPCRFPPRPTRSPVRSLEVGGSTSKMLSADLLNKPSPKAASYARERGLSGGWSLVSLRELLDAVSTRILTNNIGLIAPAVG